jgi:nucleotide-binding universal stress UspA family protein
MPHSFSLDRSRTTLEWSAPVVAATPGRGLQPALAAARPIVVLDDGSQAARNAVRRAALIAESLGAPMRLVPTQLMNANKLAIGDARLLVTHLEEGCRPSEWIFGTRIEQLVRKLSVPVLVVNQPASRRYTQVLVGVKLEETAGDLVALAEKVAPHSRVNVVHVVGTSLEYSLRLADAPQSVVRAHRTRAYGDAYRKLNDLADAYAHHTTVVAPRVVGGYAPQRLLEMGAATRTGLIVLGKRPNHWFADLFLDSGVARTVLAEAPSDVLLVPLRDR